MPEVNNFFPEYNDMDLVELHTVRGQILSSAPEGDFKKLEDEQLSRLLAIGRALRIKTAHSNAGGKTRAKATKTPTALEDLL